VSAQLKSLEDELGVRLFDRVPRGMTLTAAGQRLLVEAQRTLMAAQAMQVAAAQIRGQARGTVRMGTVSDPVSLRLGEVFLRLAQQHPQVALQLHQAVSMRTLQAVRRGELDCAYAMCDQAEIEGLELVRLTACDIVAVLPPRFATAPVPGTLAELVSLAWVTSSPECGLRPQLDALFKEAGCSVPATTMADTEGAVLGMVASGLGVGLMRHDQAIEAQRAGQGVIWQGWQGRTWLCWASTAAALEVTAVAAVRDTVLQAWA
jgi:DNA-binding transcriptional LysR family regulator